MAPSISLSPDHKEKETKVMKTKSPLNIYFLLGFMASCAILVFTLAPDNTSLRIFHDPERFFHRIVLPVGRIAIFISIGLFIALITEATGWTNILSIMTRPFIRWGHVTQYMGAAFTTAFFSGTSSLSMLMSFYKDGKIDERETALSVLLNTFPSFFLHLPTTLFIILPLAGVAGGLYLSIIFVAALLRFGGVLVYCHFKLPQPVALNDERSSEKIELKVVIRETWTNFISRLVKILLIVLPVYIIITIVSDMGFFLWLRKSFAGYLTTAFIPVESMSIVIFSLAAEFTSGYAAAGAMLDSGALNVFDTVLALLIGNIVASPVRAMRHQIPYYMGIFNPGMGMRLIILTQAFRVGSICLVGALFVLFFRLVAV
jgi:hypothetical protein